MRFIKYQGIGNDFLIVDARSTQERPDMIALARALSVVDAKSTVRIREICDRRLGVGADGILLISPPQSPDANATMTVRNADGSSAQMCGNGIRCVAKYLWQQVPPATGGGRHTYKIDTARGLLRVVVSSDGKAIEVDMGAPTLSPGSLPMTATDFQSFIAQPLNSPLNSPNESNDRRFTAVSMGNPHIIHFVDDKTLSLESMARRLGPVLEHHPMFPERTNVEFARIEGQRIQLAVWERGSGMTAACGTGACATAVAACLEDRMDVGREMDVELPGGTLTIRVATDYSTVSMTGPAQRVFTGDILW